MKKKKETSTLNIHLDAQVAARFRNHAEQLGQSYTTCMERILTSYLDAKEKESGKGN